jgi:hypothetical protein
MLARWNAYLRLAAIPMTALTLLSLEWTTPGTSILFSTSVLLQMGLLWRMCTARPLPQPVPVTLLLLFLGNFVAVLSVGPWAIAVAPTWKIAALRLVLWGAHVKMAAPLWRLLDPKIHVERMPPAAPVPVSHDNMPAQKEL